MSVQRAASLSTRGRGTAAVLCASDDAMPLYRGAGHGARQGLTRGGRGRSGMRHID